MAFNPPTPFANGIYSTLIKCAWCQRRDDFFFDKVDGGTQHKFRDWTTGRVLNRWQIVCDPCNARGRPPHYGRFKHPCLPPSIWELVMLFTYEQCAEAQDCLERHTMAPGYGPSSLTFRESPLNYVHDSRMYEGLYCHVFNCNSRSPHTGLCIHIEDLRRRFYRRQVQRDVDNTVTEGTISPALQALGMNRTDISAYLLRDTMTNVATLPQRITANDIRNALPDSTTPTSQQQQRQQVAANEHFAAVTNMIINETQWVHIDAVHSATAEAEAEQAFTAEENASSEGTQEESDYEGPRFTMVTFCRNCDTAIGVEGSIMRECEQCNAWTMCTHCEHLEACRNCLSPDSEGGQHNRWRQRFQYGGSSSSAWERFSSAQP
jgi:hypothetical protein